MGLQQRIAIGEMVFNDQLALQKILNGPCPLWVLAVSLIPGVRRIVIETHGRLLADRLFLSFAKHVGSAVKALSRNGVSLGQTI